MPDINFADISEFQEGADLAKYRASNDVLIIRAHNGSRPDHEWPAWQVEARKLRFTALGFYQYLVEGRNSGDQARDFLNCIGPLLNNEFLICDSEEGSGDEISRVEEWFRIVDSAYRRKCSLYASESWFKDKLGGVDHWSGRPRWMAAYRSTEPTAPHEWWQRTSSASFAGLPGNVDGNTFHGSSQDFLKVVTGNSSPVIVTTEEQLANIEIGKMPGGGQEMFVITLAGEVKHKWQKGGVPGGAWSDWESLGTPGQ